jgi:hypothetical protein
MIVPMIHSVTGKLSTFGKIDRQYTHGSDVVQINDTMTAFEKDRCREWEECNDLVSMEGISLPGNSRKQGKGIQPDR